MFSIVASTTRAWIAAAALLMASTWQPLHAAEPIRIGLSVALTGGVAANGKQVLLAMQIWRDDVNANGGLLGRPGELVFYDDQSNPAAVPGVYTKLIEVDKVDLTVGPYATNMIVPAILISTSSEISRSRSSSGRRNTSLAISSIPTKLQSIRAG